MTTTEPAAPEHYAAHAGLVVFPRSSTDLSNTALCPACFSPLSTLVCSRCGLDVGHPAAAQLAALSTEAASLLAQRLDIIGRIRFETDATRRSVASLATAAAPAASIPAPFPLSPPLPQVVPSVRPMPVAPAIDERTAGRLAVESPTRVPRRSSVQILLLVVGVTLLSIAAVFFLVYAFITYGLVVRSTIIAAITVASFVVATLLKRRRLRSTAEGIAVFSSLLLYLDAFAVRANDLFGAQQANGLAYWGTTLVVSSVVLLSWSRLSGLRVPSLVGFAAIAPGLGLAAGGLASALEPASARTFLVAIVVAAGGLLHPIAARWSADPSRAVAERVILLITTAAALMVAVPTAFTLAPGVAAAPALALALCGVVAIAHALLASRSHEAVVSVIAAVIASVGVLATALIGLATPVRLGDPSSAIFFWAPVAAAPLALSLEVLFRRITSPYWHRVLGASTFTAAVVGVTSLVAPLTLAVGNIAIAASVAQPHWSIGALAPVGPRSDVVNESILVLAMISVLAAAIWGLARPKRRAITAWLAGAVILIAVPQLQTNAAVVGTWLGLGLLAIIAIAALTDRPGFARVGLARGGFARKPAVGFALAATTLGYAASWSSEQLWFYGTLAAVAALLIARHAVARSVVGPKAKSALLAASMGASAILALVGIAALARQLTPRSLDGVGALFVSSAAVSVCAALIIVLSFSLPTLAIIERRVLFWIALPVAIVAALVCRLQAVNITAAKSTLKYPLDPGSVTTVVSTALLVVIVATLIRGFHRADLRFEHTSAAMILAPVTLLTVDSFVWTFGSNALLVTLEAPLTALVVAGAGLVTVLARQNASPALRIASDTGVLVVALAATVASAPARAQVTPWLSLIVLGVAALFVAISPDGLFGSRSPRRWLGWVALGLATAGLWSRLGGDSVVVLEPYVLPLAGALLAVAAILDRIARTREPQTRAAPPIALVGLLVGVIPIALEGASGSELRPALVAAVSVALLAMGIVTTPRSAAQRDYLAVASFVGAVGVLIVGIGRSVADRVTGAPAFDLWFIGAILVTLAAAWVLGRSAESHSAEAPRLPRAVRLLASQISILVVIIAIAAVQYPLLPSNSPEATPYGRAREIAVVVVLCAISLAIGLAVEQSRKLANRAVGTEAVGRNTAGRDTMGWLAVGWFALAVVGLVVVTGTLTTSASGSRAFSPIEVGTAPIAVALLIAGGFRMSRSTQSRSWRSLGAGLVILLAPSLIATLLPDTERPLWRLVALGAVSIALVIVGVIRRLQAPFVLGSVVVIIHAIATFAEQIRVVYEAVPWWLWLGVGGVLIILLAARYEHRIRNLRAAALKIGSLR